MIEVIIFDLDGLLVDSQPLQYKSIKQTFLENGYTLTKEDWYHWIHNGRGFKEQIVKSGLLLEVENLRARKKEIYDELIKKQLNLKPGASNLIDLLSGKFRLAVASSSRIESIKLSINKFGLEPKFEHLISDENLHKRKPDPEVFLHVAKIMKVKSGSCLVLEDSVAGLQAAKSAGMKCIICPDKFINLDNRFYTNANKIVGTLEEINLETIREIEKSFSRQTKSPSQRGAGFKEQGLRRMSEKWAQRESNPSSWFHRPVLYH